MDFKNWLIINEISEEIYKNAENLGEFPRKIIQSWISKQNVDVGELKNFDDLAKDFQKRRTFTTLFGWSVPCKEAVDLIKKYVREPLYDVMAGTGYWSRVLRKAGVNVRTSDIHKVFNKNYYHTSKEDPIYKPSFDIKPDKIKIRRKNALRIGYDLSKQRIKGDILLSWPPYECPVATDILNMIPIGTRVFYIGEDKGGCTGDLSFHITLSKNFNKISSEALPNFEGIHDSIYVYEKTMNDPIDSKYRGKSFEWDIEKDI